MTKTLNKKPLYYDNRPLPEVGGIYEVSFETEGWLRQSDDNNNHHALCRWFFLTNSTRDEDLELLDVVSYARGDVVQVLSIRGYGDSQEIAFKLLLLRFSPERILASSASLTSNPASKLLSVCEFLPLDEGHRHNNPHAMMILKPLKV